MRILRKPELRPKTGLSPMQCARLEQAGKFPARIVLGPRSVGWLESEVDNWIAERIAERGHVSMPQGPKPKRAKQETFPERACAPQAHAEDATADSDHVRR